MPDEEKVRVKRLVHICLLYKLHFHVFPRTSIAAKHELS